jgi:hypothetical protein
MDKIIADMTQMYGLEGSWLEQYGAFWARLVRGDLGVSFFQFPTPVRADRDRAAMDDRAAVDDDDSGLGRRQCAGRFCRLFLEQPLVAGDGRRGDGDPPDALLHLRLCLAVCSLPTRSLVSRLRRRQVGDAAELHLALHPEMCSGTRFCLRFLL